MLTVFLLLLSIHVLYLVLKLTLTVIGLYCVNMIDVMMMRLRRQPASSTDRGYQVDHRKTNYLIDQGDVSYNKYKLEKHRPRLH